jgi:hypothetical protein
MGDETRVVVERVSDRLELVRDRRALVEVVSVAVACHLCTQIKQGADADRALYELAFHYDRRHKGWTTDD